MIGSNINKGDIAFVTVDVWPQNERRVRIEFIHPRTNVAGILCIDTKRTTTLHASNLLKFEVS